MLGLGKSFFASNKSNISFGKNRGFSTFGWWSVDIFPVHPKTTQVQP